MHLNPPFLVFSVHPARRTAQRKATISVAVGLSSRKVKMGKIRSTASILPQNAIEYSSSFFTQASSGLPTVLESNVSPQEKEMFTRS